MPDPQAAAAPASDAQGPGDPSAAAALHADAVRVLTTYEPRDPEQARLRQDYLDHLAAHPDGVRREGPPAHLTVGVLVLDPSGTRVLLTHHRKADAWFQFGGHLETCDVSLRAAAARELAEESGVPDLQLSAGPVHLDRHELPSSFGRCREHLDVRYVAVAPATTRPVVSEESLDVAWFAVADLPPRAALDLAGLIDAAQAHLGMPA